MLKSNEIVNICRRIIDIDRLLVAWRLIIATSDSLSHIILTDAFAIIGANVVTAANTANISLVPTSDCVSSSQKFPLYPIPFTGPSSANESCVLRCSPPRLSRSR